MRRTRFVVAAMIAAILGSPGTVIAAPATNDDFDNATVVSEPLPFTDVVPSADATGAADDPTQCGGTTPSVWYRYTPTRAGVYVALGTAEPYGADVSIYTGTRDALTFITCGSGSGGLVLHAEAGVTYHFMVSAFPWSPPGDLSFKLEGPALIDVALDPRGQFDPHTGVARISGIVACRALDWSDISGELRQRVGRVFVSGRFTIDQPVCDGTPKPWTVDVTGDNGRFAGGPASAQVQAYGYPGNSWGISDVAEGSIRLTRQPPIG